MNNNPIHSKIFEIKRSKSNQGDSLRRDFVKWFWWVSLASDERIYFKSSYTLSYMNAYHPIWIYYSITATWLIVALSLGHRNNSDFNDPGFHCKKGLKDDGQRNAW